MGKFFRGSENADSLFGKTWPMSTRKTAWTIWFT